MVARGQPGLPRTVCDVPERSHRFRRRDAESVGSHRYARHTEAAEKREPEGGIKDGYAQGITRTEVRTRDFQAVGSRSAKVPGEAEGVLDCTDRKKDSRTGHSRSHRVVTCSRTTLIRTEVEPP